MPHLKLDQSLVDEARALASRTLVGATRRFVLAIAGFLIVRTRERSPDRRSTPRISQRGEHLAQSGRQYRWGYDQRLWRMNLSRV